MPTVLRSSDLWAESGREDVASLAATTLLLMCGGTRCAVSRGRMGAT